MTTSKMGGVMILKVCMFVRLFILAAFACGIQRDIVFAEELVVGAVASLQGGASEQGRSWLEGAQLACEELKANGKDVRLVVEDDQTQPAKAAAAFLKLTKGDGVRAVIGGTWDFLGEVLYPLAKRDRVPILTPSNPQEVLSPAALENPYVFTNGLRLNAERKAITHFLEKKSFQSAGIVSIQVPFAVIHADLVRDLLKQRNIPVVEEIVFSLEEPVSSFKTAAQRMFRKKPDFVYVVSDYNMLDIFAGELVNLKYQPTLLTTQHLEGAYDLSGKDDVRYRNVYGVYPRYDRSVFDEKYRQRFGRAPRVFAAEGYDAFRFFVAALEAGSFMSGMEKSFRWQGLKGEYRLPAPGRALVEDEAEIVQIRAGKLVFEE